MITKFLSVYLINLLILTTVIHTVNYPLKHRQTKLPKNTPLRVYQEPLFIHTTLKLLCLAFKIL